MRNAARSGFGVSSGRRSTLIVPSLLLFLILTVWFGGLLSAILRLVLLGFVVRGALVAYDDRSRYGPLSENSASRLGFGWLIVGIAISKVGLLLWNRSRWSIDLLDEHDLVPAIGVYLAFLPLLAYFILRLARIATHTFAADRSCSEITQSNT